MATIPPPAPTPFPWVDLIIILALVALNGVFAMSELAIVSARKPPVSYTHLTLPTNREV